MDFSVVVPLFNKAPYIERAIASALGQTLRPREIIVVDDGSTDGGVEVVQRFVNGAVKLIQRSPPGPAGYAARNLGILEAKGEWIAFLDADDLWFPSHLQDISTAIQSCASPVGIALTRFEVCSAGRSTPFRVSSKHLQIGRALPLATMLRAWLEAGHCPAWTGAVASKRDVLLRAGLFPAGRALRGGDKDLWLRAMALARTAYSPVISAQFHQDTINRVTTTTRHTSLPILVSTISTLLPTVTKQERSLLRRLNNHEIARYVRYATGAGHLVGPKFFGALYKVEVVRDVASLIRSMLFA